MSWILKHSYEVTKNQEHLRKAIGILEREANTNLELGRFNRVAELNWDAAQAQDQLGMFFESSQSFEKASKNFVLASEKLPNLKDFFLDYSLYMEAWSAFESAKLLHGEKKYLLAKEKYENIAKIYDKSRRWGYLSQNYNAWAKLEEAEDFSRKEKMDDAKSYFEAASSLFESSAKNIHVKITQLDESERECKDLLDKVKGEIENKVPLDSKDFMQNPDFEERELLQGLIRATEARQGYCLGRMRIEEAKISERNSDHPEAVRSYSSAIDIFEKLIEGSAETRSELEPILYLSKAWQSMAKAQVTASSNLYLSASDNFLKAREKSPDERSKRIAQGHSQFCRALEAGMRYEDNRDASLCSDVLKYLEDAANLYVKAGLENQTEYLTATQRLFNAYIFMDNASNEPEPQKKAKLYTMAEKLLESSVNSFRNAKYFEKSEEVARIYERVKNERNMAISLSEILNPTNIVSTAETFSVPLPTKEKAIGLTRMEDALLESRAILDKGEVQIGGNISLEIEYTNVGKGQAKCIKIENVVPMGFKAAKVPDGCRVENLDLVIKQGDLAPMATQSKVLVMKSFEKGLYNVSPKILYLNEAGECKTLKMDQLSIVVKELGITDWLKGPKKGK
jgi:hypothetical protein